MKTFQKIVIFPIIAITLAFSTFNQAHIQSQFQNCFPQKTQKIYFQKWVSGVRGGGSGTNFYIQFKKPLATTIQLQKIYFLKQVAKIYSRNNNLYTAHFISKQNNEAIHLESNLYSQYIEKDKNGTPETYKTSFVLKENEAVLEYVENNITKFFKIKKVKEIPLIPYP